MADEPPSWRKRKSRHLAGSGMTAILALVLAPKKGSQCPFYTTYDKTLRNVLSIQAIYTYNILLLIFDIMKKNDRLYVEFHQFIKYNVIKYSCLLNTFFYYNMSTNHTTMHWCIDSKFIKLSKKKYMHCDKSNNNNPRLYGYLTKHKENHTESEKTCVYYRKKMIFVQFLYFVKLCHMIH